MVSTAAPNFYQPISRLRLCRRSPKSAQLIHFHDLETNCGTKQQGIEKKNK